MLSIVLVLGDSSGEHPKYLLFFIAWLLGAALAGYLSDRKGYGTNAGIATGLVLSLAGAVIWLLMPSRENSDWRLKGPWGNERKDQPATPDAPQPPAPADPSSDATA